MARNFAQRDGRTVTPLPLLLVAAAAGVWAPGAATGQAGGGGGKVKVDAGRVRGGEATAAFEVGQLPRPWKDDAAAKATVSLAAGDVDPNSKLEALNDGKVPDTEDAPAANFFFAQKAPGGRVVLDLGRVLRVGEVNTFSWHKDSRGPQVYTLFGSDGTARGFNPKPGADVEPAKAGWTRIARVDTRPGAPPQADSDPAAIAAAAAEAIKRAAEAGAGAADAATGAADNGDGQYAVSISAAPNSGGGGDGTPAVLGHYRYLLFDVRSTDLHPEWDNTFFSEVDVVDADQRPSEPSVLAPNARGDRPDPNGL